MSGHSGGLATMWAGRLGLAYQSLFGNVHGTEACDHYVLLDGAMGSFALSTSELPPSQALDWTWSANLRHHVSVADGRVVVRHLGSSNPPRSFKLEAVSERLEKLLDLLTAEISKAPIDVVEHVMTVFRSHRAECARIGGDNGFALRTFLSLLDPGAGDSQLDGEVEILRSQIPDYLGRFAFELASNRRAGRKLDVSLALRHASGDLFQEAHSELGRAPKQTEMFGLSHVGRTHADADALGAFYTPPALARVVAEAACRGLAVNLDVVVMDPACGSGSFLIQAAHALRRQGHVGKITLRGYDVSEYAVEMARFAIARARFDGEEVSCDIRHESFLSADLGNTHVDVVVMNPPFRAFTSLAAQDKEAVREILGDTMKYRPDLSQAFITKAVSAVVHGGRLGTVVPVGVLSSKGGQHWRETLGREATPELIALIGAYDLFKDAMVSVACIVLEKGGAKPQNAVSMIWAKPDRSAASKAMRSIRWWTEGARLEVRGEDYSSYERPGNSSRLKESWLPTPNLVGTEFLAKLAKRAGASVADLFNVELGVRSGERKRFIVPAFAYDTMGPSEQRHFRPIAEKDGIRNGRIFVKDYLYYSDVERTVAEIRRELPVYYRTVLAPLGLNPDETLRLERARRRSMAVGAPCIVSRTFAGIGAFAVDETGEKVVVQGFSWRPRGRLLERDVDLLQILQDYCFILNSSVFMSIAREFSVMQAGGQIELRKQYVNPIPLPNLPSLYQSRIDLALHAQRLREEDQKQFPRARELDRYARAAYGIEESDWPANLGD